MLRNWSLAMLLLFSSGCSYLFMNRPPEIGTQPAYPVECTDSRAAPVLDVLGAGFLAVSTIAGAARDASCTYNCPTTGTTVGGVIVLALFTAPLLASSVSGFAAAARCERVKAQSEACAVGSNPACLNFGWDPRTARRRAGTSVPAAAVPVTRPESRPPEACHGSEDCSTGSCVDGFCRG